MINLFEDETLFELLPDAQKSLHMQCLSYAVSQMFLKIKYWAEHSRIFLDRVPEEILNYYAKELQSPYFDENLSYYVKMKLLNNTFLMYLNSGKNVAIEEMISTIFGDGTIEEWYEYGGKPYHFRIRTTNITITKDMLEQFSKIIRKVKRTTAVLDEILIEDGELISQYFGTYVYMSDSIALQQEG